MKNTLYGLMAVMLLVGGAVGYMIGNSSADDSDNDDSNSITAQTSPEASDNDTKSDAAGLRVALNNALREHVNLGGVTLRHVFTNSPDTEAAVAALDANSIEVAGLVGSVYGDEAEAQFLALWRDHITFFASYTAGARDGDQAAMDKALVDLGGYGAQASDFFAGANPNLPKSAVMPLLLEHRNLVIATVDLIGAGDFNAAYLKLAEAADQAGDIADALANGIEKQFPEKF